MEHDNDTHVRVAPQDGRLLAHGELALGGQIHLCDNPLPKRPLALAAAKHMLLGHRGTTPGRNFIYGHLNRGIKECDLDMIYISGASRGGPASR